MFLIAKQNQALEVPFGHLLDEPLSAPIPPSQRYAFVVARSEVVAGKPPGRELSIRHVVDLALDRELLMSRAGTDELAVELNRKLPPVWPGESPIKLKLESLENPDWFLVTVPSRFHNRLHRFPFEDGFFVCPVPDCIGTPRLLATAHGMQVAPGARSFVIESTCEAGHHWQCVFYEDGQVTLISVVRLKRIADLKQRIR